MGQQPLHGGTGASAWPAFSHTALTTTVPPSGQSPDCLPICHPGSGLDHSAQPRRADPQGGPAGATGAACQPPRGRASICCPFCPSPRACQAPDEIITLGPQGGQKALQAPLPPSSKAKTLDKAAGPGGPKDSVLSQTETPRPREGLG